VDQKLVIRAIDLNRLVGSVNRPYLSLHHHRATLQVRDNMRQLPLTYH
jgi:hypothetical protein